jgi:hypothetical protein
MSASLFAQHRYLLQVKGVKNNTDSINYVCGMLKDLGSTRCDYSNINHYFKIETKNMLPRILVEDYFSGQEFYVTFYLEVEEKPIFIVPLRKDSIGIKK